MSEHGELLSEAGMEWEREVRGYNRQQVDNYVAWRAGQVRELESRLSKSLGEIEHLRHEVAEARDAGGRPAHQEISERVGQILKLAADEAKSDREHGAADANDLREAARAETDKLRAEVTQETDRIRTEAQERAERMLTAAQEQADRAVATARAEAEEMVTSASAAAEQTVAEANQHAESTVSTAMAQAKQQLDEATARATAIHDGAERRLNLLISRHTETVRRLTEIRDVVTGLVSGETARGSLEDEVNRALGVQPAANGAAGLEARPAHQLEAAQSGPHRAPRQAGPADARRGPALPGALDPKDDEADPLTGSSAGRHEGGRYPGRGVDTAKHSTDAALRAAEELRLAAEAMKQQGDAARQPAGGAGSSPRASDVALDEAPAAGNGRSLET
jgi:cell division septum initiation protein DivIVA